MLKANEKQLNIKLSPELPQEKAVQDLYKKVEELAHDYDTVLWIVDLDTILAESREVKAGQETPLQCLLKYKKEIDDLRAKKKKGDNRGIHLIINQPCMEYWLLCHFEETAAPFTACAGAESKLKKHLTDYEKSERYYKKSSNDIYKRLKERLPKALAYSSKCKPFNAANPHNGHTEMHKLFEVLGL